MSMFLLIPCAIVMGALIVMGNVFSFRLGSASGNAGQNGRNGRYFAAGIGNLAVMVIVGGLWFISIFLFGQNEATRGFLPMLCIVMTGLNPVILFICGIASTSGMKVF